MMNGLLYIYIGLVVLKGLNNSDLIMIESCFFFNFELVGILGLFCFIGLFRD